MTSQAAGSCLTLTKKPLPRLAVTELRQGSLDRCLAVTYSHMGSPTYHRRWAVSLRVRMVIGCSRSL